jgi:hypothetical protein
MTQEEGALKMAVVLISITYPVTLCLYWESRKQQEYVKKAAMKDEDWISEPEEWNTTVSMLGYP